VEEIGIARIMELYISLNIAPYILILSDYKILFYSLWLIIKKPPVTANRQHITFYINRLKAYLSSLSSTTS
jgi:hypothetical protein